MITKNDKCVCIKCGYVTPKKEKFVRRIELPCIRNNHTGKIKFLSTGTYTLCENCFAEYANAVMNNFLQIEEQNDATELITTTLPSESSGEGT